VEVIFDAIVAAFTAAKASCFQNTLVNAIQTNGGEKSPKPPHDLTAAKWQKPHAELNRSSPRSEI